MLGVAFLPATHPNASGRNVSTVISSTLGFDG
jgi:hypothetical protein